ncbi:hypothetical protein [Hymenobacter arizonensis]|uniref:Uncharacterized protein n=1 Tax=Hymenobacter arizonensis TaxID=1227077 RepID=A0A1I5T8N5_HYMAR|nr:hypothetical protein [Hymenobacter arizonensis]SFP79171.1 hypothetical protein SAMN04515668_0357 [Hymenobacter arizonensis]
MNSININGSVHTGQQIVITNGRVFIDGQEVTPDGKHITITVNGNLGALEADTCHTVNVAGNCGTIQTTSGGVEVAGHVAGSVSSMSGNISCGPVGGNASTMSGSVRHG